MKYIPRIIHQTWKNTLIPSHFEVVTETWKRLHPNWKYNLWTDEMNRNFIKEHHPEFLRIYDGYPHNIQRVDAARYFILYHMGGLFIDLDFECLLNMEPLLKDYSCVFGVEPMEHCHRFNKQMIICNAYMASRANHPFFKTICTELKNAQLRDNYSDIGILESTGPFLLTEVYNKYQDKDLVRLLPSSTIYPLSMHETRKVVTGNIDDAMQEKINSAHAVHYFWGEWWSVHDNE